MELVENSYASKLQEVNSYQAEMHVQNLELEAAAWREHVRDLEKNYDDVIESNTDEVRDEIRDEICYKISLMKEEREKHYQKIMDLEQALRQKDEEMVRIMNDQ